MFHRTKVPRERKFSALSVDFSLPGTKVQRNEKAWIRRIQAFSFKLSSKLSFLGTFVPKNNHSRELSFQE